MGAWAISTDAQIRRWPPRRPGAAQSMPLDFARAGNIQVHGGIGITWESNCHCSTAGRG